MHAHPSPHTSCLCHSTHVHTSLHTEPLTLATHGLHVSLCPSDTASSKVRQTKVSEAIPCLPLLPHPHPSFGFLSAPLPASLKPTYFSAFVETVITHLDSARATCPTFAQSPAGKMISANLSQTWKACPQLLSLPPHGRFCPTVTSLGKPAQMESLPLPTSPLPASWASFRSF